MQKIILTLSLALLLTTFKGIAKNQEMIADVVFENLTNQPFSSGEFFIRETSERIKIKDLEDFKIFLPGKGRYQFGFFTDDFIAYTMYPARITAQKNKIIIRLVAKDEVAANSETAFSPFLNTPMLSDEQIAQKVAAGELNFIRHGLNPYIPEEFRDFKERYGIGLVIQNCLIDPLSFQQATENNRIISDYLNRQYGKDWKKALPIKPLGIE